MNPNGGLVNVVIPIHDLTRPLQRAVDSLQHSGLTPGTELRITVVCHGIASHDVERILTPHARSLVQLIEFDDGVASPAGPFMHGIRNSAAEFISLMGSDDTYEPGAAGAWYKQATRDSLAALIPPERHASGTKISTPPIRPWRRGRLDALRDRLAYRTAPLGLIRRTTIDELGLNLPTHLHNGSDQLFGLKLWFSGLHMGYGKGLPHYVVGADANTRVTTAARKISDELRAVAEIFSDPWTLARTLPERRAIATKSYRVHVVSAVLVRVTSDNWTPGDANYVSTLLALFREVAPGFESPLSLADRRLLDALEAGNWSAIELEKHVHARGDFRRLSSWLTRSFSGIVAPDGPPRILIARRLL